MLGINMQVGNIALAEVLVPFFAIVVDESITASLDVAHQFEEREIGDSTAVAAAASARA